MPTTGACVPLKTTTTTRGRALGSSKMIEDEHNLTRAPRRPSTTRNGSLRRKARRNPREPPSPFPPLLPAPRDSPRRNPGRRHERNHGRLLRKRIFDRLQPILRRAGRRYTLQLAAHGKDPGEDGHSRVNLGALTSTQELPISVQLQEPAALKAGRIQTSGLSPSMAEPAKDHTARDRKCGTRLATHQTAAPTVTTFVTIFPAQIVSAAHDEVLLSRAMINVFVPW